MRICTIIAGLALVFNIYAVGANPIWLNNYEPGIPATINFEQYASLNDMFAEDFVKYKSKPAYTNMGKTITYAELDEQSSRFAAFLQNEFKISKGDRFAIMMPNLLQYPIAVFGILRAGGTIVNINPLFTANELEYQLKDSQATGIIVLENYAHLVAKVLANTNIKHVIVTRAGDALNPPTALAVNFNVKYVKKMVPAWDIKNYSWFKEVMKRGAMSKYTNIKLSGDDLAFLQYTGGTTGATKAAMLTHKNMVANVMQSTVWMSKLLNEDGEIVITALPMYHIFALTSNCLTFMRYGALNVLITNPRDTNSLIKELKNFKFTAITGVNTLYKVLANHPEIDSVDFIALKFSAAGGMALQKDVADRWHSLTNKALLQAYGLTETSPAVCLSPATLTVYNGSVGVPIPSTEISIRDNKGKQLGVGEIGELHIRGPQVMSGYWRQEQETRKVLSDDGWLDTGDLAKIESNGYVYLVDRKKDMINVSGFKVYPTEVESVISQLPGVLEVAVVGAQDLKHGEIVRAIIIRKNQALSEQEILNYCRQHLTGYKVPKIVEFRESLPKSNLNKVLRRALREEK